MRFMRSYLLLLTVLLAIAGCKGSGVAPKVDNPVVGPPPPRRAGAVSKTAEQYAEATDRDAGRSSDKDSDIAQTGFEDNDRSLPKGLDGNRVVATVNGAPIFEAEILERTPVDLAVEQLSDAARGTRSQLLERYAQQHEQFLLFREKEPENARKYIDATIERELRTHVERKLLSEAMRKMLKKEQKKSFDDYSKKQLQEKLNDLKTEWNVTSSAEIDRELQRCGTSLAMVELQMRNKLMANQYIASRLKSGKKLSRQDLFAYYQQHLKDYEFKARVKWQQVLISRRDETKARAKLRILIDGITEGRDFGELATELSDGPNADNKGLYDWTTRGSLADTSLEDQLFKMPMGKPSELITNTQSYQVVVVRERQDAGHTPFDEVQDAIRNQLEQSDHQGEIAAILKELWETATIDSQYQIQGYNPNQ
jgi:parvulin-like peptidyl-prolyl isomerase